MTLLLCLHLIDPEMFSGLGVRRLIDPEMFSGLGVRRHDVAVRWREMSRDLCSRGDVRRSFAPLARRPERDQRSD